jgi:CO/xanthine dehydrogenase Mo-binding subunit
MAWENYGVPYVVDLRAALDSSGNIVAWDYESWSAARGGRPGAANPGNVATGFHAGFRQAAFQPRTPAPAPTGDLFVNDNAASQYVRGSVEGRAQGTGTVASERVIFHRVESPFFTGPLRAPARLQNTYANESFVDELAAVANADPVAYRLRHIHDARLSEVITATARTAGWDARPSPKPGTPRTGIAAGRGFASTVCEGNNGWVAAVAEVRVDQSSGRVAVTRLVVGSDSGPISNPDGTTNQIEGGALHGLSRALAEEVTWDDRQITSVDWPTYGGLSFDEVPEVEVVLIDRPDQPAAGAGESAITVVAAAVANAIFDATGARVRQVPFTPRRVKAALDARQAAATA